MIFKYPFNGVLKSAFKSELLRKWTLIVQYDDKALIKSLN